MYSFTIRFDVLRKARCSTLKLGLMIVVTTKMSPRHNVIGSNDGRKPSQLDEKKRNILDVSQALEAMASHLVKALVNVQGENSKWRKGLLFQGVL
jgi:hypothetical protein